MKQTSSCPKSEAPNPPHTCELFPPLMWIFVIMFLNRIVEAGVGVHQHKLEGSQRRATGCLARVQPSNAAVQAPESGAGDPGQCGQCCAGEPSGARPAVASSPGHPLGVPGARPVCEGCTGSSTHMHAHVCTHIHACTHSHARTCMNTSTHTHTCTHTNLPLNSLSLSHHSTIFVYFMYKTW